MQVLVLSGWEMGKKYSWEEKLSTDDGYAFVCTLYNGYPIFRSKSVLGKEVERGG